jgi:hypothetical protein
MPRGHYKPLTSAQEAYIKKEYLTKPIKRISNELNISFGRVQRFLDKNNLTIPPDVVLKRKLASQFKANHLPFNKGKKQEEYMSKQAIERTKATRFKPNHVPPNTNKIRNGAVVWRIDKDSSKSYQYIRIEKSVWVLYHRHLWQARHGPIPKDQIVIFIDGDTKNVNINNLKLISRRENMYRNSVHEYAKETIPTLLLINELETKLKSLKNG